MSPNRKVGEDLEHPLHLGGEEEDNLREKKLYPNGGGLPSMRELMRPDQKTKPIHSILGGNRSSGEKDS